jgi:hypothetical protein
MPCLVTGAENGMVKFHVPRNNGQASMTDESPFKRPRIVEVLPRNRRIWRRIARRYPSTQASPWICAAGAPLLRRRQERVLGGVRQFEGIHLDAGPVGARSGECD